MAGDVVGSAWVEIKPQLDGFQRDLTRELDRGFRGVAAQAQTAGEDIEQAFREAATTAGDAFDFDNWFDSIVTEARSSGEQVEQAFNEAADQSGIYFDSLGRARGAGGRFVSLAQQASTAGEEITGHFRESARQSDDALQTIGGSNVWNDLKAEASRAGEAVTGHFREAARQSDRALGTISTGGGMGSLGRVAVSVGGLLAAAGVGRLTAGAVGLAADLGESINAINVTLGDGAASFTGWAESASTNLGITQAELNAAVVPAGALLRNAGMEGDQLSLSLAGLAQRATDTGSVMNRDTNEVLAAMNAALRGELEPIRALGVSFSDADVQARAMAMGLVDANGEVTEAGKVQARLAIIMEQTNAHAGDFANTANSLPNLMKSLKATGGELATTFGQALLPSVAGVASGLLDMAREAGPSISALGTAVGESLIPVFDAIGPAIEALVPILTTVVETMGTTFGALAPLIEPLVGILGTVVDIFAGVFSTALDALAPVIETVAGFLGDLGDVLADTVGPMLETLAPIFESIAGTIGDTLNEVLPTLLGLFEDLGPVVGEIAELLGGAIADALPILSDLFLDIFNAVEPLIPIMVELFSDTLAAIIPEVVAVMEELAPVFSEIAEIVSGALAAALPGIASAFSGILSALLPLVPILADGLLMVLQDLEPILPLLITAFIAWKASVAGVTTVLPLLRGALTLLMNHPILIAIAALAAGFYLLYQRSETFREIVATVKEKLTEVGDWLMATGIVVWDALKVAFDAVSEAVEVAIDWFVQLWDDLEPVRAFIADAFSLAITVVTEYINLWWEAISTIIEIAGQLWTDLEPVRSFIVDAFGLAVTVVTDYIDLWWTAISTVIDWAQRLWDKLEPVRAFLVDQFGVAVTGIKDGFDDLRTAISQVWQWLQDLWDRAEPVRAFLADQFGVAVEGVKEGFDDLKTAISQVWSWIKDVWDRAKELASYLQAGFSTAMNAAKTLFDDVKNGVKTLWEWVGKLIDKIGNIDWPSPPGWLSTVLTGGSLTGGAWGGIYNQPTRMLIGEAGTEVLVPLTRPARALSLLEESGAADMVRANDGQGGGSFPDTLTLIIEGRPFTAMLAEHDRETISALTAGRRG